MDVLWSIGLQSRRGMVFGNDPDMEGIAALAEKYGLKDAVIFGKDHCGYCFHPTKIGHPLKGLTHDLTGELTEALHRRGIKAIAYVCFGMDGESGRLHPEWLREKEPGVPVSVTKETWAYMCPFTGYLKEYFMPVVMEMLDRYSVDGFFFDTMSATDYCICKTCREAFHRDTGLDLPLKENPEDPAWDVYGPWQYQRTQKCMQFVRQQIERKRPGTQVLFNHEGQAWNSNVAPDILTIKLSSDPAAHYPLISLMANYGSSFPVTGEIFIEHYARGWGDRNECTDRTLQHKAASIFAHRQDFRIGDRLLPQWRVARGSEHVLSLVTQTRDAFAKELPEELVRDPDDLFLVPESYTGGFLHREFRKTPGEARTILPGVYQMAVDCGRNFLFVMEATLARYLNPKRNLVVAGCCYLRPETETLIREFVRQGGRVLFTGRIPAGEDGNPVSWSGIRKIQYGTGGPASVYLPDLGTCKRLPDGEYPMLQSNVAELVLNGAKKVLSAYPQTYRDLFKDNSFAYYLSSEEKPMEEPLLTENRFGKGRVYFLNCSIFTDYGRSPLPSYKKWMENLFRKVFPATDRLLLSPCGEVEQVAYRGQDRSVHVLLNHGGRRSGADFSGYSEQISEPQPAYPVVLQLRAEGKPVVRIDGKRVRYQRKGKFIQIPVVMDSLWKFIRIESKA